MALQIKPEHEQRLSALAQQDGISPEELLSDMISQYLDEVDALKADVDEGLKSAATDGWLTNEEVFERLNDRLRRTA